MPPQLFTQVSAPLLGLFVVIIGNAFIASLTTLHLGAANASAAVIGIISSSYYLGLTLGALFNDRLIVRIGHIRSYSGFTSLIAVTVLLQGLLSSYEAWFMLRLINGWASIGVFLVVESWLLMAGDAKMRGRLLAFYMVALYGATMVGQLVLGTISELGRTAPFMIAGLLASLSVMPVVVLPRTSPHVEPAEPLWPRQLMRLSPTGVMGCFGAGIAVAATYTLLPLYLQRIGLDVAEVGRMMAAVILGAMILQYPVGRWSDMRDRQVILIALSVFCAVLSLLILILPTGSALLMLLLFLLGGGIFAMYPVAVSHAADQASTGSMVRMIQGLLLINSIGAALSPLVISAVMSWTGARGLFICFTLLNVGLLVFFIRRRREHPATTPLAPFTAAAQMSPAGAELRVTEDLAQAASDHEPLDEASA